MLPRASGRITQILLPRSLNILTIRGLVHPRRGKLFQNFFHNANGNVIASQMFAKTPVDCAFPLFCTFQNSILMQRRCHCATQATFMLQASERTRTANGTLTGTTLWKVVRSINGLPSAGSGVPFREMRAVNATPYIVRSREIASFC